MKIDKYLNKYAEKHIGEGGEYQWWWNGDDVLAAAISSAARHVRKDGCHLLDDGERAELKTLERYMKWYASPKRSRTLLLDEVMWLHAEAMWLLGRWFSRLWD